MLRPWSRNAGQNPGGWAGSNWEGRGYDVHSAFPEFPEGVTTTPRGTGDFQVDYEGTVSDSDRFVAELRPIAIVSFSRANHGLGFELEPAYQRHRLPGDADPAGRSIPSYVPDYAGDLYPTAYAAGIPVGEARLSTLPMQRIVDAVRAGIPSSQIDPYIEPYDDRFPDAYDYGGAFLSGFLPFVAARYRDGSASLGPDQRTLITGHIHVGRSLDVGVGTRAAEITLREVIGELELMIPGPGAGAVAGASMPETGAGPREG